LTHLWAALKDLLCLFQQRTIVCRSRGKQDRECRSDAGREEVKPDHVHPAKVDPDQRSAGLTDTISSIGRMTCDDFSV